MQDTFPLHVAAALRHLCYVGLSCAFQASYSISPYHFLLIRHLSSRPQHTPATWIPRGKYDGFGSTIVHWNCSCLHRVARTRFQSNSVVWTLAIHPSLPKDFDERVATLHFPALGAALNVLARNNQIISASRLKPLSGYSTHVRGEAWAWRSCRWSRPWLGEVRIGDLGKLFADRARPKHPRTLRTASHFRGLALPVEDGLNDFSP